MTKYKNIIYFNDYGKKFIVYYSAQIYVII